MKTHICFLFVLSILFPSCIKWEITPDGKKCYEYVHPTLYTARYHCNCQNHTPVRYDSVLIKIFVLEAFPVDVHNPCPWGDHPDIEWIVVDTFRSIDIVTLTRYNNQYDSLDTMTTNFLVVINDSLFYPLQTYLQTHHVNAKEISLKLINPPDETRELWLKFIIKLNNGKTFILNPEDYIVITP